MSGVDRVLHYDIPPDAVISVLGMNTGFLSP